MSLERIALATQAKSLSWGLQERPIDWIAALGAASINEPLTAQIARLLTGDQTAYRHVLLTIQRKLARKHEIEITAAHKREIDDALFWWIRPACRACVSGHKQIADTPMLEDAECDVCHGSGLAPHQHRTPTYGMTLKYLEVAAAECGAVVARKVA